MARKKPQRRLTQKNVINALKAHGGLISPSAEALDCTRQGLYNFLKNHPKAQKALDDIRNEVLDYAEGSLYSAAKAGQSWAVCFLLKCLGKERGFSEKLDLSSKEPLRIEITKFGQAKPD
jgi:hypothetical protein